MNPILPMPRKLLMRIFPSEDFFGCHSERDEAREESLLPRSFCRP